MKTLFGTIIFIVGFAFAANSQDTTKGSIDIQKVFGGYNFILEGQKLRINELVHILETNQPAHIKIKSARTDYSIATAVSMVGGFMVGWQLGNAVSGNSVKWEMIALGSGVAIVAIPLTKRSMKKAVGAVKLYNESLTSNTSYNNPFSPEIKLCFNDKMVGLKIHVLL